MCLFLCRWTNRYAMFSCAVARCNISNEWTLHVCQITNTYSDVARKWCQFRGGGRREECPELLGAHKPGGSTSWTCCRAVWIEFTLLRNPYRSPRGVTCLTHHHGPSPVPGSCSPLPWMQTHNVWTHADHAKDAEFLKYLHREVSVPSSTHQTCTPHTSTAMFERSMFS